MAKSNKIDAKAFSELCYSFDKDVPMTEFLNLITHKIEGWIKEGSIDQSDVPYILAATGFNDQVRMTLQDYLLKNFINVTVH